MKEMSRAELIRYYEENKGKKHVMTDPETGQKLIVSEDVWEQGVRNAINETMAPNEKLAVFLHNKLCNQNHTDRCEWTYEINGFEHQWDKPEHRNWLRRADDIIRASKSKGIDIDVDDICNILDAAIH